MSAELEAKVAALRLMLREVAATNASGIDYALRCQRERDAARAEAEEAARAYNDVAADLRRTAAELTAAQRELKASESDLSRLMRIWNATADRALSSAQRERDTLRADLAATKRELHRLSHGTEIEGDGACEHEIHADAARAWARLWHREARRLWREVQALSARADDEQTAMLALAHARRQVLESGYGHDVLDVARRAVEAVADAMLREGTP